MIACASKKRNKKQNRNAYAIMSWHLTATATATVLNAVISKMAPILQ